MEQPNPGTTPENPAAEEEQAPPEPREWETVTFGRYPQAEDGGVEPIRWQVIRREAGRTLLVSEKCLASQPFQIDNRVDGKTDLYTPILWENCSLRDWMNGEFFDAAFTEEEKARMLYVSDGEPLKEPFGDARDEKVFLLSLDEVRSYYASDKERVSAPTPYAIGQGASANSVTGGCQWWLRSAGYSTIFATMVYPYGFSSRYGYDVYMKGLCVRPCIWVTEA